MHNPISPFDSIDIFRQQFHDGLDQLLELNQLSTFILVFANATQDQLLFDELKLKLEQQYHEFIDNYRADLAHGNQIDVVDEDFLVFLKMYMLGFDQICMTQQQKKSIWQYQFNHIRSFKPGRVSSFHNDNEITAPYDRYTFNFNKQFMQRECFWRGDLNGRSMDLFYNKYPFARMHGLCVPQKENCLPQLLTDEMHKYIWELTEQLSDIMPGIGFGYNSYGAYASVNHLHFQMFIDEQPLAIEDACWQHNAGDKCYPLNVHHTEQLHDAWQFIQALHQHKQPYNLLYRPGEVYIIPRKVQGSVEVPIWSSGFTWYEMAGSMLVFNQEDYQELTSETIHNEMSRLAVDLKSIV